MIKLYNTITEQYHNFEIFPFPDGTSQVWKINPAPKPTDVFNVIWMFENEVEYVHILQMGFLLHTTCEEDPNLIVPFLPYARQDKEVKNDATFAVWPTMSALKGLYGRIHTYDVHSNTFGLFSDEAPANFFLSQLEGKPEDQVVIFPDKGAYSRYNWMFHEDIPVVIGDKVRNQQTGHIIGFKLEGDTRLIPTKRCIIFDDICDGGATFIKAAEALEPYGPKQIDLVISHGLFTKGKGELYRAGISKIVTTNSLLRNKVEDSNDSFVVYDIFEGSSGYGS